MMTMMVKMTSRVNRMNNMYRLKIIEPLHEIPQCGILTCVDSVEPLQPHFKLRNSKRCSVSSLTIIKYSSD